MSDRPDGSDQAPEHDAPVPYMQRTRDYYLTLGYGNRPAHNGDENEYQPVSMTLHGWSSGRNVYYSSIDGRNRETPA